jgi:hypothetical protein
MRESCDFARRRNERSRLHPRELEHAGLLLFASTGNLVATDCRVVVGTVFEDGGAGGLLLIPLYG